LAADFPNRPEFRRTAANHHTTAALRYFHDMKNTRKGEELFRGALAAWREIDKETPDDPAVQAGMARAYWWLGALLWGNNRPQEAEPELRRALMLRDKGMAGRPGATGWLDDHLRNKFHLAQLLLSTGKPAEAESLLREAIVARERLIRDHPNYHDYRR